MIPLVSVVIPNYNYMRFLPETIESVLNQTYRNIEIVLIDNYSNDGSWEYAQRDNIRSYRNPFERTGEASTKFGIEKAKGEWIKYLSADDVLFPDAIQNMMDYILCDADNKRKIYYADFDVIDENSKIIDHPREPDNNNLTLGEFQKLQLEKHIGNLSTTIINREIFDIVGWFNHKTPPSDIEWTLRASFRYGIRPWLIPILAAKYRHHSEQQTNQNRSFQVENAKKIREMIKNGHSF